MWARSRWDIRRNARSRIVYFGIWRSVLWWSRKGVSALKYAVGAYELGILRILEYAKTRKEAEEIAKKLKSQFQKVEIIKVARNESFK